jgi:hypothetical protein
MLLGLFRRRRLRIDDPDFGQIEFHRRPRPGWENGSFAVSGRDGIQLLVDADEKGPTDQQRKFLKELKEKYLDLEPRIDAAIREKFAVEHSIAATQELQLRSIYIPTLREPIEHVWRLWYDLQGEDMLCYGVEMSDWDNIVPFAED